MNKKILTLVGCASICAFSFTSCVKNEESDGVKAIREAKAREINADAHKTEITNQESLLTYDQNKAVQELKIEGKKLTEQAAIDLAKVKAQKAVNDLKIAKMEAEVALLDAYAKTGEKGGLTAEESALLAEHKADLKAAKEKLEDLDSIGNEILGEIATLLDECYGTNPGTALGGYAKAFADAAQAVVDFGTPTDEEGRQQLQALKDLKTNASAQYEAAKASIVKLTAEYNNLETGLNAEIAKLEAAIQALKDTAAARA